MKPVAAASMAAGVWQELVRLVLGGVEVEVVSVVAPSAGSGSLLEVRSPSPTHCIFTNLTIPTDPGSALYVQKPSHRNLASTTTAITTRKPLILPPNVQIYNQVLCNGEIWLCQNVKMAVKDTHSGVLKIAAAGPAMKSIGALGEVTSSGAR